MRGPLYRVQRCASSTPAITGQAELSAVEPVAEVLPPVALNQTSEPNKQEPEYHESEAITVQGRDCPKPFLYFNDYQWPPEVEKVLTKHKYTHPTPIQAQGFPVALEGRDMVGIAQTGSGKTLSFIMPAVVHVLNADTSHGKCLSRLLRKIRCITCYWHAIYENIIVSI